MISGNTSIISRKTLQNTISIQPALLYNFKNLSYYPLEKVNGWYGRFAFWVEISLGWLNFKYYWLEKFKTSFYSWKISFEAPNISTADFHGSLYCKNTLIHTSTKSTVSPKGWLTFLIDVSPLPCEPSFTHTVPLMLTRTLTPLWWPKT